MINAFRAGILISVALTTIFFATGSVSKRSIKRTSADIQLDIPAYILERNIEAVVADFEDQLNFVHAEQSMSDVGTRSEGFHTDPQGLPESLRSMWNNSLMLLAVNDEHASIASTFVSKVLASEDGLTFVAHLVTNFHVVEDYCNSAGECPGIWILNDLAIDENTGDVIRTGENLIRVKGVRLIYSEKKPDLALLRVEFDARAASIVNPAKIQLTNPIASQTAYVIGFPHTAERTTGEPIEKQNLITKRWSVGEVQDVVKLSDLGDVVLHTADALPGNSGSALYDNQGTVIGVNVSLINARDDNDYHGGGSCGLAGQTQRAAIAPSLLAPYSKIPK